ACRAARPCASGWRWGTHTRGASPPEAAAPVHFPLDSELPSAASHPSTRSSGDPAAGGPAPQSSLAGRRGASAGGEAACPSRATPSIPNCWPVLSIHLPLLVANAFFSLASTLAF